VTDMDTQVNDVNEQTPMEGSATSVNDLTSSVDFQDSNEEVVEQSTEASGGSEPSFVDTPSDAAEAPQVLETVSFDPLTAELPEVEELRQDGFYEDLTADHIKDLPPVARRMLHNFRVAYEKNNTKLTQILESKQAESTARQQKLEQMERDFARRQAEFYALVDDPKVRETLQVPEEDLPDALSPEGIQARIDRGIAQGMQRVLNPLHEAANTRMRESAYLDFVDQHPEMRDPTFKKEVVGLVRARREGGENMSTQDAYQLVKAQQVLAKQQARQAQEQRARASAARRVSRTTASGSPGNEGIPANVKRKGAVAIAQWLKTNPEAARKIGSNFRH